MMEATELAGTKPGGSRPGAARGPRPPVRGPRPPARGPRPPARSTFVAPVPAAQLPAAVLRLQAAPVVRGEVDQRVVGQALPVQGLQDLSWWRGETEAVTFHCAPTVFRCVSSIARVTLCGSL